MTQMNNLLPSFTFNYFLNSKVLQLFSSFYKQRKTRRHDNRNAENALECALTLS